VSWKVTIPGQPPSSNHAYKVVRIKRGGGVPFHTLAKTAEATAYQQGVRLIVAAAKPSGWRPEGQIRLRYRLFLDRDIDCDNVSKILNDAIARALDVNDKIFLPCYEHKETGHRKDARVEVEIE